VTRYRKSEYKGKYNYNVFNYKTGAYIDCIKADNIEEARRKARFMAGSPGRKLHVEKRKGKFY
jgi:hypothetical protein